MTRKEPRIVPYPNYVHLNQHRQCCGHPVSNPFSCPAVPQTAVGTWSPMEPLGKINMDNLLNRPTPYSDDFPYADIYE